MNAEANKYFSILHRLNVQMPFNFLSTVTFYTSSKTTYDMQIALNLLSKMSLLSSSNSNLNLSANY